MSEPLLKIDQLTKRFGGVVALDRVRFQVHRGKIVSLIGPNGAGKTTLFNCISGLIRPEEGTLQFGRDQFPLQKFSSHEVARMGIARTFQNIRLFPRLTTLENVLTGALVRTHSSHWEALWPWGSQRRQEERWAVDRARRLLERLDLEGAADQLPHTLPYGRQRRLELARALASDPQLLLLDEPAAGLNSREKKELMSFLLDIKRQGITILLIEHDMKVVMPVSDWVVVLDHGAKIAEGEPKQIQENPKVVEAYLGVGTTWHL